MCRINCPKCGLKREEELRRRRITVPSEGKVMPTIFWDSHGVVLIEYAEKGKQAPENNYAGLLSQLKQVVRTKHPHLAKK